MKFKTSGNNHNQVWTYLGKNRSARGGQSDGESTVTSRSKGLKSVAIAATRSVSSFASGLIAAMVGAGFATVFTLNYLEPFKAEENLRKFALSEMYKPMRAKAQECVSERSQIYAAMAQTYVLVNLGHGAFRHSLKSSDYSLSGATPQSVEPLVKTLNESLKKVYDNQLLVTACSIELDNLRQELATVLGINNELTELQATHRKSKKKEAPFIAETNKFLAMLLQPEKLFSLVQAVKDGTDGHITRADAAYQKVDSMFVELLNGFKVSMAQQEKLIAAISLENREINELFLRDLKVRFEKTPTSYLKKSLPFIN